MINVICTRQKTAFFTPFSQLAKAKVNVRLSEKIIAIKSQNTMKAASLSSFLKEATVCTTDDDPLSKSILIIQ